jgi:hypothetical protein
LECGPCSVLQRVDRYGIQHLGCNRMLLQRIQLVASEARVGSLKEREKSTFAVRTSNFVRAPPKSDAENELDGRRVSTARIALGEGLTRFLKSGMEGEEIDRKEKELGKCKSER